MIKALIYRSGDATIFKQNIVDKQFYFLGAIKQVERIRISGDYRLIVCGGDGSYIFVDKIQKAWDY